MNAGKSNFGAKMNLRKREKNTYEMRLGTASLQASHFKCLLKKKKKISYSDVAYVAEDVLTYNLVSLSKIAVFEKI